MSRPELKIGAVIDSETPASWVVDLLSRIQQRPGFKLVKLCIAESPNKTRTKFTSGTSAKQSENHLSNRMNRLARRIIVWVDRPRTLHTPVIATPLPDSLGETFELLKLDDPTQVITPVDLWLQFVDNDLATRHLHPNAQYGVWSARTHTISHRAELALLSAAPYLVAKIFSCEESQKDGAPLWQSLASHALPLQSFSLTDIKYAAHACLPALFESRLNWLANNLEPATVEASQLDTHRCSELTRHGGQQTMDLSATTRLWYSVQLALRKTVQRVRDRLQHEQWQLAFVKYEGNLLNTTQLPVHSYQTLAPPDGRMWADPHITKHQDKVYVFFEDLEFNENKGRILTAELSESGFVGEPVLALEQAHHLSYPFVFTHDNVHYMIPETAARRTVTLYRAVEFPAHWQEMGDLLVDGDLADSTLLHHDGWWWLFTNSKTHPSVDERDELRIFFTRDFRSGQWQAHPLNPVVTGVDRARMAGPVFMQSNNLYRPSQLGAYRYGYGINLSKITSLSTTQYQETLISSIKPDQSDPWLGCHTLAHDDQFVVIDRVKRRRKN